MSKVNDFMIPTAYGFTEKGFSDNDAPSKPKMKEAMNFIAGAWPFKNPSCSD